jgi:hypothetical protein
MAEITDFPERRDQISIAADEIGKELKKMQGYKTVGPENERLIEIFGGRNIPRKITFAHMQELLKDMSPIAGDENTIFTLSQVIEEKFPGTIDKKNFADFEERFGSVLDTQDAGKSTKLPANDPGKKKDPTKITLREAAELYRKDLGTQKITRFNAGSSFAEYGDMTVVEAFTGERGERPIDKMGEKAAKKSPGAYNDLMRDLRFVSIPVRREIALATPDSPILSSLPAAEAAAEQTKIVLGPSMPTAVEADIRILTANKKGWGELFTRLEGIASDPKNPKAAVADALLTTFYTGPRGGLIANLKGYEYKPDSGSIRVVPQTKAKRMAGEAGEAGAQKSGGIRQAAIPYNVPLNEDAVGYIERRMKYNEANPDIVKFIRDSGTNHIFVKRNAKGKPTKVSTTDMSQLLGEIEVSQPLIEDAVSGKEYNSLYPTEVADKTAGKWGEALARNFHASVGLLELKIEGQTMDFLQGRSETSGTEGRSQTKKLGYAKRPTGFFTSGERDAQQQIANWINSTTGRTAADIPGIETRISPATYAIPGFFDTPVEEVVSSPKAAAVEEVLPTSPADFDDDTKAALKSGGFNIDYSKIIDKGDKILKGLLPVAIGTSAIVASREAEAQGDTPFVAGMKGVAAGASELVAPPGMAFSDKEFREDQRATTPGGSGLGPRTDVAPQTDALGYIKPEFAMYPMEDAPRESFLDTELKQP